MGEIHGGLDKIWTRDTSGVTNEEGNSGAKYTMVGESVVSGSTTDVRTFEVSSKKGRGETG